MKKLILTVSALAFSFAISAQNLYTENWPNGNKKTEGHVIGDAKLNPADSKENNARQMNSVIKDGKWTSWFENGAVRSEETYNKGTMIGTWKVLFENGQTESFIDFSKETAVFYHRNGNKHSEGGMKTGMIHSGKWTGYYESGAKNYEGSYDNAGNKTGTWTWYDENGKPSTEQVYNSGNVVSTKTFTK
jgi:antitoxin component YwqK of YwqJK toxin-antitoxin module